MPLPPRHSLFSISRFWKFVSNCPTSPRRLASLGCGFRISCFFLFAAAHAGSIETFDGVTTTGTVTLDTGLLVIKPADGAAVKVDPAEVLRVQFTDTLPGDNLMPGVILRNGARVTGAFGPLTDPQVKFEKRGLLIPGGEIAWIIYQPFAAKFAATAPLGKTGALLAGGDFFEGTIKAADDKTAKIMNPVFGPRTYTISNREFAALILRDPRPSAAQYEVRTSDGAQFGVDTLTLEKTGLTLKHPLYDGVKIELRDLVEIRAGASRYQPLTALKPARVELPPGRKMEQCFAVDKTLGGDPLDSLGAAHGRGFESVLGVGATWEVPAGFNVLSIQVAVPAGVPPINRLVFAIYADGHPVARSGPLSSNDKPAPLRANLGPVRSVSLRVEAGFPTNATGSGLWLEPTLLRK